MNSLFKLFHWYFSRKALPYWGIFLFDCLIVFLSGLLIYALNNGVYNTLSNFWLLAGSWGIYLSLIHI